MLFNVACSSVVISPEVNVIGVLTLITEGINAPTTVKPRTEQASVKIFNYLPNLEITF